MVNHRNLELPSAIVTDLDTTYDRRSFYVPSEKANIYVLQD